MSGQLLNLTMRPTNLSVLATTPTLQAGADAIDLLGTAGNRYDFSVRAFLATATSSPTITVALQTSMYNGEDPSEWVALATFPNVTTSNSTQVLSVNSGVLRYVRWKVSVVNDSSFTFEILGVAW